MTTEQAAEHLGMVAVVWPRAAAARRAELYAGLSAEQREAVRVLFGYGAADSTPEPPAPAPAPPAPATPAADLIAALQNFTASLQREKPAPAEELPAAAPQIPATGQDSRLPGYLRLLAEQIEQRQAPPVVKPAPSRTPSKPAPRPKVTLPAPPVQPALRTPARTAPTVSLDVDAKVRRAGNLAVLQCWLFIIAVIVFPLLLGYLVCTSS